MRKWTIFLMTILCVVAAKAAPKESLLDLPEGTGLPLLVNVGISFIEVSTINENEGAFEATIELRLRWRDLRLRFPKNETATGYKDYRNSDADAQMQAMWIPSYDLVNMDGESSGVRYGIRISHDGSVEMLHRLTGRFKANFNVERFPFDYQSLSVDFQSHKLNDERLKFQLTQEELEFSRPPGKMEVTGWRNGLVTMKNQSTASWYGERNSGIMASLVVQRDPSSTYGIIFLPLLASLLIPLMVVWLNQAEIGGFKVEAFELTNISIGGLFAVVALNFTILSSFGTLAGSSNCVNQLFTLNYFALGMSFVVNIVLYKFNVVARWYGDEVQAEFYRYVNWAMPALILIGTVVIMLYAML